MALKSFRFLLSRDQRNSLHSKMIGRVISNYRVVGEIGRGAMGVVYLAEHTVLGRRVAIKTATNANHGRFLREARAASALSHPHIATIHDYGETDDGEPYIVMEYVQGKTLAALISEGSLNIPKSLRIIRKVAEALDEAHRHNMIHRDIKPSNIMVDDRNIVKVLDFGLAKQIGLQPVAEDTDPHVSDTTTGEGLLVGTPMYFSPEQAQGVALDPRSDLFSLGAVLYECLVGKPAFSGATPIQICTKVIRDNPVPPSQINPAVSGNLERVIVKALEKSVDKRYQSANELASDLQILEGGFTSSESGRISVDQTQPIVTPDTVIIDRGRNLKRLSLLVLGALFVIATSAWFLSRKQQPSPPEPKQERLGFTGNVTEAAISPDGKFIAYIIDDAGRQSILLRQITTGTDLPIVSPADTKYKGLSFFPNGDYLSYLKAEGKSADLHKVSTLGGPSRKLSTKVDTPVSFSPDGKQFTFVRYTEEPDTNETTLIIADADGNNERAVATLKAPQLFSRGGVYSSGPAWSPDGTLIAVPAFSVKEKTYREIVLVNVADGTMNAINPGRWNMIEKLVWLADSSGFLMNASEEANSYLLQIWLVNRQGGEALRITKDPSHYAGLSATKDSRVVLTMKNEKFSSVLIHGDSISLPSSRYLGDQGIAWTADSRFVLASNIHGNYEIWTMNVDGSNRKQVTFNGLTNVEPVMSRNGRYIVFASFEGRHPHIWRVNADGTNLKQLTSGGDEDLPRFTPDGEWVVYHSINSNKYSIRKVSIDGGEPFTLVSDWATQPDVSPDGKLVACFTRPNGVSDWEILVVPIEGGPPIKKFALPATVNPEWPGLRWTPDGKELTYVSTEQGVSNVWRQALTGGEPKPLTDFKENKIFFFDWSHTNQKLVLVRGSETRDLILVSDFLSTTNDSFQLLDLF